MSKKQKTKKSKLKMKTWNVFFKPIPYEVELVVNAYTLDEAIDQVKGILADQAMSIRGGWEIKG